MQTIFSKVKRKDLNLNFYPFFYIFNLLLICGGYGKKIEKKKK